MATTDSIGTGSPLSDIDSDEFTEDVKFRARSRSGSHSTISTVDSHTASVSTPFNMPPSKRRRTGTATYDHLTPLSVEAPLSPGGSISSDTSGSVPTSPSFAHLGPTHPLTSAYTAARENPEDPEAGDPSNQITRCLWTDCPNPEQGNMDNLVHHIHEEHIGNRQKRYSCEWEGCSRKSSTHASGYALRAHMRSHTKEKPFFCALPECDRSFTRSDALAKHMRTVHETEALRPSDPVPRGHSGGISNGTGGNLKRIKLIVNGTGNGGDKRGGVLGELPPLPTHGVKNENGEFEGPDIDDLPFELPVRDDYYPNDVAEEMDDDERAIPPSQWFRWLRRQVAWAEEEGKQLEKELQEVRMLVDDATGRVVKHGAGDEAGADMNRKLAWQQTELLLDDVLRQEMSRVWAAIEPGTHDGPGEDPWQSVGQLEKLAGS